MLRNGIVIAALTIGLLCIGLVVSADNDTHRVFFGVPTFLASAAPLGE